ncbi:MAG TPA: hypothetical protein PKA88_17170 [Polyangiaceae bacterium]|nr:hypothetical protein [Polyangiaceae bacterium]
MKRAAHLALGLCLFGTGCDKTEQEAAPAPAATPASAVESSGAEQPAVATDESDIPTEQDFEDEAETQITASNLESELDNLEKEIGD